MRIRVRQISLATASGVLALWLLLTTGIGLPHGANTAAFSRHAAEEAIQLPWLMAALLVLGIAWAGDRGKLGLRAPRPLTSLRLVWLPFAYACFMFAVGLVNGPLATGAMLVLLANMLLVGLSEELMFRGILFQGLLTRCRIWPAVILTSLIFGAVHTLNVFTTGDLNQATMQAVSASMQGFTYLAIRIRTGSVWPMAVVHGLWDFSLMHIALARPGESTQHLAWSPLPLLIALPIFLYGVFLLRHLQRDYGHWSARGVMAPSPQVPPAGPRQG